MSLHNIVAPFTDFYFDFISIGILLSDHAPTYTAQEMGKWATFSCDYYYDFDAATTRTRHRPSRAGLINAQMSF